MRRGVAILAAGASRRLGQPKQLVLVEGEPLLRRVARLAEAVGCEASAVVLGCEAERVGAVLQGLRVEQLSNPAWAEGMASSIRVAAGWAEERQLAALMLLVCDQIRLDRGHLLQLWAAWEKQPELAVGSSYAGTIGIPAIFPRAQFAALLALQGDRGAAPLLRAAERAAPSGSSSPLPSPLPLPGVVGVGAIGVSWADGVFDLDTIEDLRKL